VAFRLRRDESAAKGLRRLAVKQLWSAEAELQRVSESPDEAVHQARKRIKKTRALLQLIEEDRGRHLAASGKQLRAVNRRLSKLRDADATLEVLEKLRRQDAGLLSEHTVARVRRMLSEHKHETVEAARRDRSCEKALRTIRRLQKAAKRWRPRHEGFKALAEGIRAAHRRGRRAMMRALERKRAPDFHEWRKQIKMLWYGLRLLEPAGLTIQKDMRALERAEEKLGDDHNTVVLCDQLFGRSSSSRPSADLDDLRCAAQRYQVEMRLKALSSVRGIYRLKSDDYVGRIKTAWDHWHRAQSPRDSRARRAAA
jgi:CHAD domain-containing protein